MVIIYNYKFPWKSKSANVIQKHNTNQSLRPPGPVVRPRWSRPSPSWRSPPPSWGPKWSSPWSGWLFSLPVISPPPWAVLLEFDWFISSTGTQHVYPTRAEVVLQCNVPDHHFLYSLAYEAFLLILCTVYAVKTRKVPENFNETRYIGFSMYGPGKGGPKACFVHFLIYHSDFWSLQH